MILLQRHPYRKQVWHAAFAWRPVWVEQPAEDTLLWEDRQWRLIWLEHYLRFYNPVECRWFRRSIT